MKFQTFISTLKSRCRSNIAVTLASSLCLIFTSIFFAPLAFAVDPDFCKTKYQYQPDKGNFAYQFLEKSSRCEGLISGEVSAIDLALVAVTQGNIGFDISNKDIAHVQFAQPSRLASSVDQVSVEVRSLSYAIKYRLNAQLAPSDILTWDTDLIMRRTGVKSDELGILARAGNNQRSPIVPVIAHNGQIKPNDGPVIIRLLAGNVVQRDVKLLTSCDENSTYDSYHITNKIAVGDYFSYTLQVPPCPQQRFINIISVGDDDVSETAIKEIILGG